MVKQRKVATAKATVTPKNCFKCKSGPASMGNLCVACIAFLGRIFVSDAPLIDRELATILNTPRPSGRERSVKTWRKLLIKVIKSSKPSITNFRKSIRPVREALLIRRLERLLRHSKNLRIRRQKQLFNQALIQTKF